MRTVFLAIPLLIVIVILGCGGELVENRSPVFDKTRAVVVQPEPPYKTGQILSLTATATDPDGDTITYTWIAKNSNGVDVTKQVFDKQTGNSIQFVASADDIYQVIVTASDGNGGEVQTSQLIKVARSGENLPPMVERVSVQASQPIRIGQVISLEANAYDPDGDEITYSWKAKNSNNDDVTKQVLQQTTGKSVQFVADAADTYQIIVVASDRKGGENTNSLLLKIVEAGPDGVIEIKVGLATSRHSSYGAVYNRPPLRRRPDIFTISRNQGVLEKW